MRKTSVFVLVFMLSGCVGVVSGVSGSWRRILDAHHPADPTPSFIQGLRPFTTRYRREGEEGAGRAEPAALRVIAYPEYKN